MLEATDGGDPPRIGTADIFIDVININDNSPQFDRSFYVAEVSEGLCSECILGMHMYPINLKKKTAPALLEAMVF